MEQAAHELEPDKAIRGIIEEVDKALGPEDPREPGKRVGACGLAADLVKRSAERHGASAQTYQLLDVHRIFGGNRDDAFQHGFNVLSVGDQRYLVDESFVQFIDPATQRMYQGFGLEGQPELPISGTLSEHPVAEALLKEGYVLLTDETLREYLRASSTAGDKSYIDQASVERLVSDSTPRIPYDHTTSWLDQRLAGEPVAR